MRSSIHGTFATLLLLIPVGAIPALAIFGIPQFAPVVASPLREDDDKDREHRVGESARAPADDLFHDDADFPSRSDDITAAPGRLGDSVPVPNRHISRDATSFEDTDNQTAEASRPQPSWADDSAVGDNRPGDNRAGDNRLGDKRPSASQRRTSEFDPLAGGHDVSPQDDSRARRPRPNERDAGAIRLAGGNAFDSDVAKGYQRQRETPSPERTATAARDDVGREVPTWQDAVRRLNELEIRNFRLEPSRQPNQFVFICSYTSGDSPHVSRRFEAESDEPLKAVEKVLAQIEEWRQRR